jgi:hypothetical protein
MSDEDFLSRWSRRKREAAQPVRNTEQPVASSVPGAPPPAPANPAEAGPAKPEDEFDLASLPPIESITATTDITAFLRKGVPLELSRAALRRAWESDPVIRDFVGLAENAWDFNDPNAMPGFGPLDQTPEQVRELAARIVGRVRHAAADLASASEEGRIQSVTESEPAQIAEQQADLQSPATAAPPGIPVAESHVASVASSTPVEPEADDHAALQRDESAPMVRRTHGGALPR